MSDVYVMNERRTLFRKTVLGVEENINTFKLEKKMCTHLIMFNFPIFKLDFLTLKKQNFPLKFGSPCSWPALLAAGKLCCSSISI